MTARRTTMRRTTILATAVALLLAAGPFVPPSSAASEDVGTAVSEDVGTAASDPRAVALAESVLERLGGRRAWESTRVIRWRFFGKRLLVWDTQTGDLRLEIPGDDGTTLILMNVVDRTGRAWKDGRPLIGDELADAVQSGYEIWINDSYWMFMPYKLLDPGVTLHWIGEGTTTAGSPARVIELTFHDVGVTPQNRYRVYVGRDSGLVEQWDYYAEASDTEPSLSGPWAGWTRFGGIWLATDHGRGADWDIAVPDVLPRRAFTDPDWRPGS